MNGRRNISMTKSSRQNVQDVGAGVGAISGPLESLVAELPTELLSPVIKNIDLFSNKLLGGLA